jgi:2-keto-4-pentenoate hydratase
MDRATTTSLASELFDAFEEATTIAPLTDTVPGISVEHAYGVQRELVSLHCAAGRTVVGRKVGLTSRELRRLAGIDEPDYGVLFDTHTFASGVTLSRAASKMIQPRLEAELGFVLERELRGPGVTHLDVLAATRGVCAVFEIVDSRIHDWRLELPDTIADNSSSWGVIVGPTLVSPLGVDLTTVGMVLEMDGEVQLTGAGAAVLDHPAAAVAWLANKLAPFGEALEASQLVLSGSFTRVLDADPATYAARFGDGLGRVELTITD